MVAKGTGPLHRPLTCHNPYRRVSGGAGEGFNEALDFGVNLSALRERVMVCGAV